MNGVVSNAVVVAGFVLVFSVAVSWAGPPNPTDSDTSGNTAGGTDALLNVIPGLGGAGQFNTAFGFESLKSDTAGSHNTTVGFQALSSNTTGGGNTATGDYALVAFVTGGSSPGQIFAAGDSSPDHITQSKRKLARQTTTFGTLGIVAGQTVRLSAVRQPDEDQGVTVCRVDLNIFDIHGNRQAAVSGNLDPGKGAFLDLARADVLPPLSEARAQVYAVVDVTSNSKDGKLSCHVAMSIEIFDQADGRTRISQGAFSDDEPRNLAPVGSKAACPVACSLEDSSCPDGLDCWQNPATQEFRCCNGRP